MNRLGDAAIECDMRLQFLLAHSTLEQNHERVETIVVFEDDVGGHLVDRVGHDPCREARAHHERLLLHCLLQETKEQLHRRLVDDRIAAGQLLVDTLRMQIDQAEKQSDAKAFVGLHRFFLEKQLFDQLKGSLHVQMVDVQGQIVDETDDRLNQIRLHWPVRFLDFQVDQMSQEDVHQEVHQCLVVGQIQPKFDADAGEVPQGVENELR